MFYWNDKSKWTELSSDRIRVVLGEINRLLARQEDLDEGTRTFVHGNNKPRTDETDLAIPVTGMTHYRTCLSFYKKPCWLFKLTCAHDSRLFHEHNVMEKAYESPAGFVVLRAASEKDRDALGDDTGFDDILLINWNSASIQSFNETEHGELDLASASGSGLDEGKVRDYLRFFTGFIQGDSGPFLCLEAFDELAISQDYMKMRALLEILTEAGYREGIDDFAEASAADAEKTAHVRPEAFSAEAMKRKACDSPDGTAMCLAARTLYGSACFDSTYRIAADGAVSMEEDDLVAENPRWGIHETGTTRNGRVLLLRRQPRRSMSADELRENLLTEGKEVHIFINLRVNGNFDHSGLRSDAFITFRDVEFTGHVTLDEVSLEHTLRFESCRFAQRLCIKDARIMASLELDDCVIFGFRDKKVDNSLCLKGLRTEGGVRIKNCRITGPVDLHGMRVKEDCVIEGLIHYRRNDVKTGTQGLTKDDPAAVCLDLGASQLGGALRIRPYKTIKMGKEEAGPVRLCGALQMSYTSMVDGELYDLQIARQLDASSLECRGWLQLAGSKEKAFSVRGYLSLTGSKLRTLTITQVDLSGWLHIDTVCAEGMVSLSDNRVGHSVDLSGGCFGSDVELTGTSVEGSIRYFTGKAGRLSIKGSEKKEARIGGIWIKDVGVLSITILNVQVFRGNDPSFGIAGNVNLEFLQVQTTVRFYLDTDQIYEDPASCVTVLGAVRIRSSTVGGHMILSNLVAGDEIRVTDSRIEGDLRIQEYVNLKDTEGDGSASHLNAHCPRLVIENTTVALDADLTGLDCRDKECTRELNRRFGAGKDDPVERIGPDRDKSCFEGVKAPGLIVRKRLFFVREHHVKACLNLKKREGTIPGKVDLSGSEIKALRICGDPFRRGPDSASPDKDHNLDFFDARIGLFEVLAPFPEQVGMTGLRVERWHGLKGKAYIQLLKKMSPLDTAVYTAVEHSLRLEGKDDLANRVYIAMRRRMFYGDSDENNCSNLRAYTRALAVKVVRIVAAKLQAVVSTAGKHMPWLEEKDKLANRVYSAMRRRMFCGDSHDNDCPNLRACTRALAACTKATVAKVVRPIAAKLHARINLVFALIGMGLTALFAYDRFSQPYAGLSLLLGWLAGYFLWPVFQLLLQLFIDVATGYWTDPKRLLWLIAATWLYSYGVSNAPENYEGVCASTAIVRGISYAVPVIDMVPDSYGANGDDVPECHLKKAGATHLVYLQNTGGPADKAGMIRTRFTIDIGSPNTHVLIIKILGWLFWPMLLVGMSVLVRGRTSQAD